MGIENKVIKRKKNEQHEEFTEQVDTQITALFVSKAEELLTVANHLSEQNEDPRAYFNDAYKLSNKQHEFLYKEHGLVSRISEAYSKNNMIVSECKICNNDIALYEFIGAWNGKETTPVIDIYACTVCQGTQSFTARYKTKK